VIAGKDDPIVPPTYGQAIANRIRNSRLELVDCGHLFVLTMAEEIAAMVDGFLGEPAVTTARASSSRIKSGAVVN
jgi:pimeloyl-ACP methyl ester carboxylesterase